MCRFSWIMAIGVSMLGYTSASADEEWIAGNVGNWNDVANWNNAIPAPGGDVNARARGGGTITMNSVIDTTGVLDIQLSDQAGNPLSTLIWNPGNGSTAQYIERILLADHATATAEMTHLSGSIHLDNQWFHIARRGTATYSASGSASVTVDDLLSIAEGAGSVATLGVVNLSGNASITTTGNNESYVAVRNNAVGFLNLADNSAVNVRHLRVGHLNGAAGTVTLANNATLTVGNTNNGQLSLGREGAGTLVAGDSSRILLKDNTSLRIGDNDNGVGAMTMNGNARVLGTGNGQGHVYVGDNGTSVGSLVMNNTSGLTDMRRMWIGGSGTSNGTVTMNDSSFINLNREQRILYIANAGTANGTLVMNDNATITTQHLGADSQSGTQGGVATIVQNNNSKIMASGWAEIGGGNNDTSTWTLNDNSQVLATANVAIGELANGVGVLNLNQNAFFEASLNSGALHVGRAANAEGVINVNDNAFLYARGNVVVGESNGSLGTINQNSGTVRIDNTLILGNGNGGSGNAGTYNLNGGTLRTDKIDIRSTGTFNWGAGTLTMRENNSGSNGNGVQMEITGANNNLATSTGSILDLGDIYISNGINYDTLDMNDGTLNLSAVGDTLEIWRYVSAFRPAGAAASATYEIQLISGNIINEFDNVTGPGPDYQYFRVFNSAEAAILGLTPGNVPRNRGFIDYRPNGAFFVFNVGGMVPEPSTGLFLLFGTVLLRGVSVMRRNQRIRRDCRG
ncbi:MAG: hypothetical protein VCG02_17300 [Verrucomicrobiota bacterium]